MNIVIIGGGSKFGRFAAEKFINHGHEVYVMSHKIYEDMLPNHVVANFEDTNNVLSQFDELCKDINQIDMFIYLTRPYVKEDAELFVSNNNVNNELNWIQSIRVNASIPHDLVCRALSKMNSSSRVIFMTTGISLTIQNPTNDFSYLAMYAGTKSAQNFLMRALAFHNDKNAVMCSISTHFPNQFDKEYYEKAETIFNLINTVDRSNNGQIVIQ